MIDYEAMRATIASEKNIEVLRGVVVMLLGVVDQRRETLRGLDPIVEPAFRKEESDRTRGQLGQTHTLDVMRALARDAFKGLEALNVQIARLPTP